MSALPIATLSGIRGVIVDLDGTMLDTAADFHAAINRMRRDLELAPMEMNTIIDFVGKGTEHLVRQVLAVDFDDINVARHYAAAMASYRRHYLSINGDNATLYPEVMAGLSALRAKDLRLACVTNKPIAFTLPLLEKKGLRPYFEVVYGGDSLPAKKPDPMPLLQVCADFNLAPHEVVAIGDSSNDARAARAAGCRVLTVPYGYNHGEPVQSIDSDGIVSTLLDAAALINP